MIIIVIIVIIIIIVITLIIIVITLKQTTSREHLKQNMSSNNLEISRDYRRKRRINVIVKKKESSLKCLFKVPPTDRQND